MAEMITSDNVKTGGSNVVEKLIADLTGGRELDMTGVTTEFDANQGYIPEGTPIILDAGAYKPLLSANLVADGPKAVGILYQEVPVSAPYASIAIKAVVNEAKLPFALDAAAKSALNSQGVTFI